MAADFRGRLERAQQAMATAGIDVLVAGASADLRYLTGIDAHLSERMNLLVLSKEGRPSFVVPTLEAPNVRDKEDLLDLLVWGETESPAQIAAKAIGASAGTIAVSDTLHAVFLLRLQDAVRGARWVPAGPILRDLRMRKDTAEIETMREAALRTDAAWAAFLESGPLEGLTERQAMDRLNKLMAEQRLEYGFGHCGSGPNSASPHYSVGDRVIQRGDAIVFDFGGILDGYYSDMTRTVVVDEPSDEYRRVYETVLQANDAAFDAVRPGASCESIDTAARGVIEEAGYGSNFIHRVGHGLGMEVHEEPYLVNGNQLPLAAGMVFSDEPGIYLDGKFGVRIEDTLVCTDSGAERINTAPRDLAIVT